MKLWQSLMIALARNRRLTEFMHRNAAASALARHFVGGRDLAAAIATARELQQRGVGVSLFYLGEYVADPALVRETVAQKIAAIEALATAGLDVHVSVDPTQIGYSIDADLGRRNGLAIGQALARVAAGRNSGRHFLMLDMEDCTLVTPTLRLREELAATGVPVAQTLQAYLRRTAADLKPIIAAGGAARLVKGAFADMTERAFPSRAAIDANYLALVDRMLSDEARKTGFYPIFGTHDERLALRILALAETRGWPRDSFEFEMLYGVRPRLQALLADGARLRLYLPFGEAWFPYAIRRVGESPRNIRLILRALAS
jgi:proline dehydrogenase